MRVKAIAAALAVLTTAALPATADPQLRVLGTHESGLFNVGGAEIPTYDPLTRRAFVVNAGSATVDVLDLHDPSSPTKVRSLDIVADLAPRSVGAANSLDTRFGVLAVAVEADPKQDDGYIAFYSTVTLRLLGVAPAGALPDMITFSQNGHYVLTANEGEPDATTPTTRKARSPSSTSAPRPARILAQRPLRRIQRGRRRGRQLPAAVRIYGPGATVAQDLEPEYITTDGRDRLGHAPGEQRDRRDRPRRPRG